MQLTGLIRVARDVELRYLSDGTAVCNIAGVYTYGKKKDGEQYKPSQFVEIAVWGKQAEGLAEYLKKGVKLDVSIADLRIETFQKNDGTQGVKMVGRLRDLEFAGGESQSAPPAQSPSPPRQAAPQPGPSQASYDDDFDDIPF